MSNKKTSRALRMVALLLAIVLLLPVGAMAADVRSSLYLHSYSAYIYPAGWGKVQVWFSVDGINDMDMFKQSPLSIAMGNAVPQLKQIASHVTTNASEDGIKNACLYFQWI